ncbi:AAA family ATPase [Streptomyces sp. NPDC002659]|uniref:helix-turn-helix transcriptional regulator n=1 Tax=Streptomyces sp. NPDC002659 TaxID=3364656 RepID=UPI0036B6C008
MTDTARGLWEREAEAAVVADAVKIATHGNGGLLLVEGPAGIGKTRLLAEAWTAAAEAGARVVRARGTQLERDFAFGVVRQLFEPLVARMDQARLEVLWQGPAAQARPVFEIVGTTPTAGPAGDFAVLHGLYWLTANAAQDHPLVLLVDDLQWCDTPSLGYLAYLLPRIEDLGVLVAAALRTGEAATDERLIQQITTDPAAKVLQPHPLSAQATAGLLEQTLPGGADPPFAAACHQATGGNPLLLHELARTLTAENVRGSADNVALVRDLGSRAVAHLVALRMTRLPQSTVAVAKAAAVLGGQADLVTAAALADQDTTTALEGVTALERLQILRAEQHNGTELRLAFIHPLVQAAVHDSINPADLATAHHHAARLLTAAGADPERIAAHLLRVPPGGDPEAVTALRAAAAAAAARGAPSGAHTYLARALHEPLADDERLQVLTEAGRVALLIDTPAAADHFHQAYTALGDADAVRRAQTAVQYASTLLYSGRIDECERILTDSINQLPADEQDLRRQLQAWLVIIVINFAGHTQTRQHVVDLYHLPPDESPGGRMLECALALHAAHASDLQATELARRGLSGGPMFEIAANFTNVAWWALITADAADILDMINDWSDQVHRRGDTAALTGIYVWRGWAWLRRGQLIEAETDLRRGASMAEMTGLKVAEGVIAPQLAQCVMEQGRLEEATTILEAVSSAQIAPHLLDAQAQLLYLRGEYEQALQTALTCQDQSAAVGLTNPAGIGWRTWAALALQRLDRTHEAHTIAAEDLRLARQWCAPRALGRALRVNGLLNDSTDRLQLLHQAAIVLENSTAQLEHAKALTEYGGALRRTGHRTEARSLLRHSLDLATRCGATPLADFARTELAAAGGHPRRTALAGPDALTPSEHRVAELAATGATNRQIAQDLYVTPKTVEVHLSAAYRKLDITTRTQLPAALAGP